MSVISSPVATPHPFSTLTPDDFVKKAEAAGQWGRVEISEDASGTPEIVVAKRTFKDRVLSCLSKIPLFQNMDMVKRYVARTQISKQKLFSQFINALTRCYGVKASLIAFDDILSKNSITTFSQRVIRQLDETAQDYHGRGTAKFYSRQVELNLWPYENINKCGHASLTLNNHERSETEHVSWWPNKDHEVAQHPTKLTRTAVKLDRLTAGRAGISGFFEKQLGGSNESYEIDKFYEIQASTRNKLENGNKAREEIKNRINRGIWKVDKPSYTSAHLAQLRAELTKAARKAENTENPEEKAICQKIVEDLQLLLDSKYYPRALQAQDAEGDWGVVAQKIYFPMAGKTMLGADEHQQKSAFIMFGLCEKSIFAEARHVKANADSYAKLAQALHDSKNPGKSDEYQDLKTKNQEKIRIEEESIAEAENEITELSNSNEKLKEKERKDEPRKLQLEQENKRLEDQIKKSNDPRRNAAREATIARNRFVLTEYHSSAKKIAKNLEQIDNLELTISAAKNNISKLMDSIEDIREKSSPDYLEKTRKRAEETGKEIGYTYASDDSNCASMAIRLLRSGGAENFVKLPKMSTLGISMIKPDEQFSSYARNVQNEMDRWNQRSDAVLSRLQRQVFVAENETVPPKELEDVLHGVAPEWEILTENEKKSWAPVVEAIAKNLPAPLDDMSAMTEKTKNLVTAAETLFNQPAAPQHGTANEKGMQAFLQKAFNMHKSHISALSASDGMGGSFASGA